MLECVGTYRIVTESDPEARRLRRRESSNETRIDILRVGGQVKTKVDCLHSLFDFNQSGELTVDEMVIFFRVVAALLPACDRNHV